MTLALDVVLIRGAPGAGKSTLGRRLRKLLSSAAVVEVDDVRAMLSQVDWNSRHHHDQAIAGTFALVRGFLDVGLRPVFVIDTLSRSRLMRVHTWLEQEALRHHILSLWVEPEVLRQRLEQRTSGFREWDPSAVLNAEVMDNRWPHETLLDAGSHTPDALAASVLDRIMGDMAIAEVAQ